MKGNITKQAEQMVEIASLCNGRPLDCICVYDLTAWGTGCDACGMCGATCY